ncbi:MAG: carbohydrate kinase family protein [Candidatus Moraniibacteriota bacterium]
MFQVICIGSSSKDIFFPTKEGVIFDTPEDITAQKKIAFELGAKYQIDKIFEAPGGCAANVAQGLSRLGIDTACYTKIGKDEVGKWIEKELKKEKVSTKLIQIDKHCKSDVSVVIVDEVTRDHVILFNRESNTKLEINPRKIKNTKRIFISALNGNWEKNVDEILAVANDSNISILFNPGQRNIKDNPDKVLEIIERSEVLILNKDEAIEIMMAADKNLENQNLNDEIFLLNSLMKLNKSVVVLTDGENGSWAAKDGDIFFAKVVVENPVDTLGAGDSFSSGFLAGYINGKDMAESLRMGIANGVNVIMYYGAKEGLLNKSNVGEFISGIDVKKIN